MLSHPDAALAQRDPAIPGLSLLLDTDRLVAELHAHLPGGAAIAGATIDYLRYKPGTNCMAAYRLRAGAGTVAAHAIAYRPDLRDKLDHARKGERGDSLFGPGGIVLEDHAVAVIFYPRDGRLKSLPRLSDPRDREKLLRELLPDRPELSDGELHILRYKPRRRFVASISAANGARAALKLYAKRDFPAARANAAALAAWRGLNVARPLGHAERHHALAFEWLPGRPLSETFAGAQPENAVLARIGMQLAALHAQNATGLAHIARDAEARSLFAVATGIGDIAPQLAKRAHVLARALAERLTAAPVMEVPMHGDFYADQVLVSGNGCGFLDFDRAAAGDPAADLGNFIAHLQRDILYARIGENRALQLRQQLLDGYEHAASGLPARTELYTAASLLRLTPEPFRRHEAYWPDRIEAILARAESIASTFAICGGGGAQRHASKAAARHADDIGVSDPRMPFLAAALTPTDIQARFSRHLPHLFEKYGEMRLSAARVVRHKPGRRCLIEYDLVTTRAGVHAATLTLIGKARARGLDEAAFRRQVSLWNNGFDDNATDGVSVPEPVGMIPPFQMWLQRKLPGVVATGLLAEPGGITLAERIAHTIHKLHRANIPARRRHTMTDELRILRERLSATARLQPHIDQLLNDCERLAARMRQSAPCGIHRDFYPDQVLVDGQRLCLLDLDLYCEGDPALDIGNFLGHMTEYAVRELGHPEALIEQEAALEERYLALAGGTVDRATVQGYKTLTLARHIHISTLFAERRAFTHALLELCEHRLGGSPTRIYEALRVTPRA